MAQRDPYRANGGEGIGGLRLKRQGWPGYAPAIQPGEARLPSTPDQRDARTVVTPPAPGAPFDPRNFNDHALAQMLGIQGAMSNDHIRMLVQTMLDNMLRATFKPAVQPPWVTKPFVAMDFGDFITTATIPTGGAWTTIAAGAQTLSFTMAQGRMGVVREIAQGVAAAGDWGNLCWRIAIDGQPMPKPWNNICCQISSFTLPRTTQILVMPGQTVTFQASNSSLADIVNVSGFLIGWHWPVPVQGDVMNAHGQASVA